MIGVPHGASVCQNIDACVYKWRYFWLKSSPLGSREISRDVHNPLVFPAIVKLRLAVSATMPIDQYRMLVASVMEASSRPDATGPEVFENFGHEHAHAVIEAMLRAAKSEICIYAKIVASDVFDRDLLRAFYDRNPSGEIRILVDEANVFLNADSALYGLQDIVSDRFSVRVSPVAIAHMAIVDRQYARLEASQSERKAVVCFGNKSLCEEALQLFKELWDSARPIPMSGQAIGLIEG